MYTPIPEGNSDSVMQHGQISALEALDPPSCYHEYFCLYSAAYYSFDFPKINKVC